MSNQYETVFIMNPVLSDDQVKDTVAKFKKILTENGAEIVHENNWGLKKLAYPIQKKNTGFYYLIEFKAPGDLIAKVETDFKRDERIMRFLTLGLDKHAIAYNEKRRKLDSSKEKEKEKEVKEKEQSQSQSA
ncbi:MAG: 30S ribosomal protein S6 [Nitrosopumilus sp.]|nr:30S ribosomal protein S6 [Nitrosopumilus sp.]